MPYHPSALAEPDFIEIVSLRSLQPNRVGQYMQEALDKGSPSVRIRDPELVGGLVRAWRSLSGGEATRCHTPIYGLRFHHARRVTAASVCWNCDNVFGYVGEEPLSFLFDGHNQAATTLLGLVMTAADRIMPRAAISELLKDSDPLEAPLREVCDDWLELAADEQPDEELLDDLLLQIEHAQHSAKERAAPLRRAFLSWRSHWNV